MLDTFKDYLNALLGAVFLLLSIIFIPEIRAKTKYWISVVIGIIVLAFLGIDKINRDKTKDEKSIAQHTRDTAMIHRIDSTTSVISDNYKRDTMAFADFKTQLIKFNIRDSANTPIRINNYNTTIGQARDVNIGGK